jgi:uncharacterized protein YceH (UPF0502 family)
MKLSRQPGQKEARFAHLLSGEPNIETTAETVAPVGRVAQLEEELQQLRAEFNDLKRRFEVLEAQLQ